MSGLLFWCGPVEAKNLAAVQLPPDWRLHVVNRGIATRAPTSSSDHPEIGSDGFRALGQSLGKDPLAALLMKAGAPTSSSVMLAGFSAAHGLFEVIFSAQANDPRLVGCYCADAYYMSTEDVAARKVKPGYLAFAKRCAEELLPFWLTTSRTAGPTYPSGSGSVAPLATALRLQPEKAPDFMPAPDSCRANGGVMWLDYGSKFSHVEHATKLAPQALKSWFVPGQQGTTGGASSGDGSLLALALLGAWLWSGK